MDETLEKKVRSLRLKLLMAERELHAASGKWKLGAMLGAGHMSAMNREIVKVKDRLEGKIEKLKQEISLLTGETFVSQAQTPAAEKPRPYVKPVEKPKPVANKPKPEAAKKAAEKKAPAKKAEPVKKAAKKVAKKAAKPATTKTATAKSPAKKSATKKAKK